MAGITGPVLGDATCQRPVVAAPGSTLLVRRAFHPELLEGKCLRGENCRANQEQKGQYKRFAKIGSYSSSHFILLLQYRDVVPFVSFLPTQIDIPGSVNTGKKTKETTSLNY